MYYISVLVPDIYAEIDGIIGSDEVVVLRKSIFKGLAIYEIKTERLSQLLNLMVRAVEQGIDLHFIE